MRFAVLLRGINVSGQKKIKMADLKTYLEDDGFSHVETYIQSGNIILRDASTNTTEIRKRIANIIKNRFGYEVDIKVLSVDELMEITNNNPFSRNCDVTKLHVTLLERAPDTENIPRLTAQDYSPEEFILQSNYLYVHTPNGYGRAKLNNNYIENKLKVSATTRNWKTINKLTEMISHA